LQTRRPAIAFYAETGAASDGKEHPTPMPNKGPGTTRSKVQREYHRALFARWKMEGYTLAQMASKLRESTGVALSRDTISGDLQSVRDEWVKVRIESAQHLIGEELAFLEMYENVCWQEWHRSRNELKVQTSSMQAAELNADLKRLIDAGRGDLQILRTESSFRTQEQLGDPRYLVCIQWARSKKWQLLGLTNAGSPLMQHFNAQLDVALSGPQQEAGPPAMPTDVGWTRANAVLMSLLRGGNGIVEAECEMAGDSGPAQARQALA
jgi:hypothetical protein